MDPRLRIINVRKSFGGTHALRNVSLELAPGEVHAVIGENGAGKSTLMKILSGAYQPDAGEILLNGEHYAPRDPLHARRSGVEMIYQELTLAPHLSVEENILLGAEPARFGCVNHRERRRIAQRVLAELHSEAIPLDAPIYSCSIAQQQMVEIARTLVGCPQVLIMDEPTSSLTQVDADNLFAAICRLKAKGVSIIYISHFLEECQRVADCYTVLRDGETVGSGDFSQAILSDIIHLMVGRELDDIYPQIEHRIGEPVLELKNLAGKRRPEDASLTLRKGEILGVAGLVGAGRTETLRTLFGLDVKRGGQTFLRGREVRFSPSSALKAGLGLLSENRKEEGLMLNLSLTENLTLPHLKPFSKAGLLDLDQQRQATSQWLTRLKVRARNARQVISELSGGNQQKIAIGRLLHCASDIFLLDEPTRGVDVASKAQIYALIGELAALGKSIIFVSSYLPELLGVCDTIAVMCRGRITDIRAASEWTEHSIISAAIGHSSGIGGAPIQSN
jgi:ribose transport system ATP-binding protein